VKLSYERRLYYLFDLLNSLWSRIRGNQFLSNASVYVLGSSLQKAISFLLIPLYIRYLTPSEYGIVGLGTAITGFLTLVMGVGLRSAVARFYYDYDKNSEELKAYITTAFLSLIIIGGVIGFFTDMYGENLWKIISTGQVTYDPYVRIMIWISFANAVAYIPITLYQTAQRPVAFVISNSGLFLLNTVFVMYFVIFQGRGALGQLQGQLYGSLIMAVILSGLLLVEHFSVRVDFNYLRASLLYALPLIPHTIAGWALSAIDRILLENGISLDELGLYNLAYQLGMIMSILVYGVNQAWLPYYFSVMKSETNRNSVFRKVIIIYIVIMGSLCLLGSLFSSEALQLIAPDKYLGSERYIPPILFAYLWQGLYFFASSPLFFYKKTKLIPLVTLVSAIVNIVLNLLWIPRWGAMGSAWATTISFMILFMMGWLLGTRFQKIHLPVRRLLLVLFLITIGVVVSTLANTVSTNVLDLFILLKILYFAGFMIFAIYSLVKPVKVRFG
jgi:O-antigen/teichoic acid export membrane protein